MTWRPREEVRGTTCPENEEEFEIFRALAVTPYNSLYYEENKKKSEVASKVLNT